MKSIVFFKKFLIACAVMASPCGYSSERQQMLSESELKGFFSSIVLAETNVVFTFNKSGSGFVYRMDQQGSQISEDGKAVSVPSHSTFKVFDRHFSLTFTPMIDKQGATTLKFGILFKKDFRSMGASVTTNSACLVPVSEPTGTTARTMKTTRDGCLYGLQLLPLTPLSDSSQTAEGWDR